MSMQPGCRSPVVPEVATSLRINNSAMILSAVTSSLIRVSVAPFASDRSRANLRPGRRIPLAFWKSATAFSKTAEASAARDACTWLISEVDADQRLAVRIEVKELNAEFALRVQ